MIHKREISGVSVEQVMPKLEQAVADNGFGVLGVHDLSSKMRSKGLDFASECRVVEVCNPVKAKQVLEADMDISNALPCRLSVYSTNTGVTISTLLPTKLLSLFEHPELARVAEEVEETVRGIMDTVAESATA